MMVQKNQDVSSQSLRFFVPLKIFTKIVFFI